MLVKIIRELTKTERGSDIISEKVSVWAKRVEAQEAKSRIITSLSKTKNFNKIKTVKGEWRQY